MKKLTFHAIAVATLALCTTGCQLTHVKTPEWEVSLRSHWFKRDVDKFDVQRNADGSYSVSLNGYHSDASEQFNAMLAQSFQGLAAIGRIAGAAFNPAVATIPLTNEGAAPASVASVVQAQGAADSQRIAAKAAGKAQVASAKAAKANTSAASSDTTDGSSDCPNGDCGYEE